MAALCLGLGHRGAAGVASTCFNTPAIAKLTCIATKRLEPPRRPKLRFGAQTDKISGLSLALVAPNRLAEPKTRLLYLFITIEVLGHWPRLRSFGFR